MENNHLQVKVFQPNNQTKGFFSMVREMFKDLFDSAELAKRIFIRDTKAEYRQSLLGILWAFITPFFNALVWIFLSASGAVTVSDTGIPYPLFVFLGTLLWAIFTESVNMPLAQTSSAKGLISKINFPKEAILLAGFYKLLFSTSIKLVIIIAATIVFGYYPTFQLFTFFIILLIVMGFGISLGLLITPIGMLYKDIGRGIPILLSLFMYISPVVYKNARFGALQEFLNWNPMTPLLNSCRNVLTGGAIENHLYILFIVGATLIVSFIGWIFYRVSIPIIVERM